MGRAVTKDDVSRLAVREGARQRVVLRLGEGDSLERLDHEWRKIWGPAVVTTELWDDGGTHQAVRFRSTISVAELNALIDVRDLDRYAACGKNLTVTEWAREPECKVSEKTLRKRVREGTEITEAIQPPHRRRRYRYAAYGKNLTVTEWAREPECVVSAEILWSRIHKHGWEIERALSTPPRRKGMRSD